MNFLLPSNQDPSISSGLVANILLDGLVIDVVAVLVFVEEALKSGESERKGL